MSKARDKTNTPPDRSAAIKTLIERWIEKNKAKEPTQVLAINATVAAKSTDEATGVTTNTNLAKEAS